ncbi:MAG TPA: beta-L-arabinofuranosidase domain-containing protein [Asticcacaulis sp.]|nr:beta-L-arabinofuranosidase domain-containing protein [Asticcacaulis sp.]
MRRRTFIAGAAAMAGAAATQASQATSVVQPERAPLEQLGYGEVTLLDGPVKAQFSQTYETLLNMDEDALLRPFRQAAGQPIGPKGMGGWYDFDSAFNPKTGDFHGFIPGHSFGQYVSALSRGYAVSGDARGQAKVRRLLAGFAPTITAKFYDGYPLPAYTYDKTLMGLLDAHQFAKDPQALALVGPATDAVLPHLPERALDRNNPADMATMPKTNAAFTWDETYTLPENLYIAAARGGGPRYRDLARRYLLDAPYFDKLAAGDNVLPGRHAYSHLNALNSAMQAYLNDGAAKHLQAAQNGLGMVVAQSYATGGWGPNEGFVAPGSGGLGKSLNTTHASFETPCGTYGQYKLSRYLIRVTGDSRYGDSMERLLYNASLGALPLKASGAAFYYSDYNDVGSKFYHESNCTCCSGTIGQLTADYGISSYFRDAKGLYVNLYIPSKAVWREGVTVTQQTQYPLDGAVALTINSAKPVKMAVRLRIPAWAGPATAVTVNGEMWKGTLTPGTFAELAREWSNGDKILLTIDRPLRFEAVDEQHPNRLAVVQGPLALFATGDRMVPYSRAELARVAQTAPGSAEWALTTDAGTQAFKPYFAVGNEAIRLYQFATA